MYDRLGIQPPLTMQLESWLMEIIIIFPADLIIAITLPDGPFALPVFIFAIGFDIIRPWDQVNLVLNSIKNKAFFIFFNLSVSWIKLGKVLISQLSPPKFRYFADQNEPKGATHENKLWQFSNTKMIIKTVRAQNVGEKMGSFL